MKTSMQELLENLQKSFDEKTYPIMIDGTYFLEKEKEQMLEAIKFGQNNHTEWIPEDEMIAKNYFNDKYEVVEESNQNK